MLISSSSVQNNGKIPFTVLRFLLLLVFLLTYSGVWGQSHLSPARIQLDSAQGPFYHGVASGDPMPDRVILWTRVTTSLPSVQINWQMATDTLFSDIVLRGQTQTDSSRDYTVKVDAIGLQADHWYYYRFRADSIWSPVGRTRTAPVGSIANLRFAVVSCSNFQDGFFNAYRDIAKKNDVDAIVHLGDYIYEYGIADFSPGVDSARLHIPQTEVISLHEYRVRHSQYKLDADLQEAHRQLPFMTIWDDHETANDSWTGGADNHQPVTEGPWDLRKEAGRRAYFEWMPIRDVYQSIDTIHRVLNWGDLAQFILLDTRLEGREEQLGVSGPIVTDTARTLLGKPQWRWFRDRLTASTAHWKLIGNQVMIAPLRFLGTPVNKDQWDGYPAERSRVLSHIERSNIQNVVFLTGDIHSSWANDVPVDIQRYTSSTGAGSTATELVCTSITSSNVVGGLLPTGAIYLANAHIKYIDLLKHGYLLLDLNRQRLQGDWILLSTVTDMNYTSFVGASWQNLTGIRHLTRASNALMARTNRPAPAPRYRVVVTSASDRGRASVTTLYCGPNPATDLLTVQYYQDKREDASLEIVDITGGVQRRFLFHNQERGLHEMELVLTGLNQGVYTVKIQVGEKVSTRRIVVTK